MATSTRTRSTWGEGVAGWVEEDFRAYLRCGILAHGFARIRCDDCLWTPSLLWMHVISDSLIGLACFAIPPALQLLVVRARREVPEGGEHVKRSLPHEWMFLAFGLFIVACGTTHFVAVWNAWNGHYWKAGGVNRDGHRLGRHGRHPAHSDPRGAPPGARRPGAPRDSPRPTPMAMADESSVHRGHSVHGGSGTQGGSSGGGGGCARDQANRP